MINGAKKNKKNKNILKVQLLMYPMDEYMI